MVRVQGNTAACRLLGHSVVFSQPTLPVTPTLYLWDLNGQKPLLGSAASSSAASLATEPFEYVLDLSCPILKARTMRGNLNIQFYYGINEKFPKCDKCVVVISSYYQNTLTLRIHTLTDLGGRHDNYSLLSSGAAKKARGRKGGRKRDGWGAER